MTTAVRCWDSIVSKVSESNPLIKGFRERSPLAREVAYLFMTFACEGIRRRNEFLKPAIKFSFLLSCVCRPAGI